MRPLSLVTGGAGFLGSALVAELLHRGHRVRTLDDGSRGRPERLAELSGVEPVRGDVRDPEAVAAATRGVDVVWHLAAVNGTESFYASPDRVLEVGVAGTLFTIRAAAAAGAKRYVLASSSEVYHQPPVLPTPETVPLVVPDPHNPRFSYAGSKIAGELMALHLARARGLESVVVRPHNVYGPDMGEDHVIPQLVRRLQEVVTTGGRVLTLQGDGSQTRAFCYVGDAARGVAQAGLRGSDGSIFNVGRDEEVTIADLARRIARRVGIEVDLEAGPRPPGATPRRCPDIAALRALGFEPAVPLDVGLERTVDWYLATPRGARPTPR